MLYAFKEYFIWHFSDVVKEILKGWRNFLVFYLDYFSVASLFKTFFAHWHKYYYSYGRGFDPWRYFEAFVFNSMSRIIGALLRSFFILFGILAFFFILLAGSVILLVWIFLPLILALGLWLGIGLLL